MKTSYLLPLLFLFIFPAVLAQEIKLQDGIVAVDGKPAFSYNKKGMNSTFQLFKYNTEEEIVLIQQQHVGADTGAKDDFKKITFAKQNVDIESLVLQKRNWKFIIQLLLIEKVINTDGMVNDKNLERFAKKYDEKLSSKKQTAINKAF